MLVGSLISQAQTGKAKITGNVVDGSQKTIESASIALLRAKDSSTLKFSVASKDGQFVFEDVANGKYMVSITAIGYQKGYSETFEVSDANQNIQLKTIELSALSKSMNNVIVTAKRPFIEQKIDKMVINVESSITSAGSSALDVLEKSPGVTVDKDGNISLKGKQSVMVMMDGKPAYLSGADLVNYLRSLPASALDQIEIMTNPSAKYDAAGNSGIIDIRMKKDQRLGTNGNLTAGYGQGIYPKTNAGGTFNYRNKKVNVFGNYNYAYRELLNHLIINRNFYDNGTFTGSDNKDNFSWSPFSSNTARLGADFFPAKNTIIGFVVNSTFNHYRRRANITTIVNDDQAQPDFKFFSLGTNNDHFKNTVANINLKQKLDSTGKEITADVDYGIYNSTSLTRTASSFYNMDGTPKTADDILDGDQTGKLNFKTGKVDFTDPMNKGAKLEAGFKTSFVSSDNDAKFYDVYPNQTVVDSGKTNRFFYDEYNNAGYVNFSKEYKKFNYQLGLRGEQTNVRTRQVQGDKRYKNDYFKLFPSAFFNYKLKEDQTVGLSVSRRIDRPGYSQLNPFLFQIDPTIYGTGNPFLKPQMTWSYELSYTLKKLNFTFGYSHTTDVQTIVLSRIKDVIPDFVIKPGESENITVQIPVNLTSSDYIGITANSNFKIAKWWNMINNANIYYQKFNGDLAGVQLNNGSPSADFRTNNTFTFKKGWGAELNANVNSGGRYGYMVTRPQWGVAVGTQKNVLKGKGTIRFNMTDIFWTNLPKATVIYEGRYVEHWHASRETRVANLTFTYRFGNSKVQQARRRATASEEERQRAGN